MNLFFKLLAVFTFLALFSSPVLADEMVSLKAGYLLLTPEGTFSVDGHGFSGTNIDLEDDLGVDDSKGLYLDAALQLANFRLGATYTPLSFEGSGQIDRTIIFNGQEYPVGTNVDSDVDIDMIDAGLTMYLLNFDDLPVRIQLGPEIGLKYFNGDASLKDTTLGVEESEDLTFVVPQVGARARIAMADFVGVTGHAYYMRYSDNQVLDGEIQVEFSPLPLLGLFAGYRYFDLQVEESDIDIDIKFSGPFGGIMARF